MIIMNYNGSPNTPRAQSNFRNTANMRYWLDFSTFKFHNAIILLWKTIPFYSGRLELLYIYITQYNINNHVPSRYTKTVVWQYLSWLINAFLYLMGIGFIQPDSCLILCLLEAVARYPLDRHKQINNSGLCMIMIQLVSVCQLEKRVELLWVKKMLF